MTALIKAYKKYKECKDTGCEFAAFENYVMLVYPSQVAETIEHYEAELYRLRQALNSANARGNLRFNLGLRYLQGQELAGNDWDYISEEDAKRIEEAIQERLKQVAKPPEDLWPAGKLDLECQMELNQFLVAESYGDITPDDGSGNYGTITHISSISCWDSPPEWATHVYWYNK